MTYFTSTQADCPCVLYFFSISKFTFAFTYTWISRKNIWFFCFDDPFLMASIENKLLKNHIKLNLSQKKMTSASTSFKKIISNLQILEAPESILSLYSNFQYFTLFCQRWSIKFLHYFPLPLWFSATILQLKHSIFFPLLNDYMYLLKIVTLQTIPTKSTEIFLKGDMSGPWPRSPHEHQVFHSM